MRLSGITKDGKPLADYLGSTEALRLGLSKLSRKSPSARTSQGVLVYEAGQKAQKVVVCDSVFPYADKSPFPLSGHSALGALVITADEEEVQCHDCGEWFRGVGLGQHVRQCHDTAREYKIRHGLRMSTGLVSPVAARRMAETMRTNRSRDMAGKTIANSSKEALAKRVSTYTERRHVSSRSNVQPRAERQNLIGKCKAQRIELLKQVAVQLGRTPYVAELKEYKTPDGAKPLLPSTLRRLFECRMNRIYVMAGLPPSNANREAAIRREAGRRMEVA